MLSSAYLSLLLFLLAFLIPACDSSGLAFCMIHSAYKLDKQGDNSLFQMQEMLAYFHSMLFIHALSKYSVLIWVVFIYFHSNI